MDQSDLDLLQSAPAYHLQLVAKMRHLPISPLALNNSSLSTTLSSPSSSATVQEIARHLFNPTAIATILEELSELECAILRELVSCGGRANSRDLALYFSTSPLLQQTKPNEPIHVVAEPPKTYQTGMPLQPPQYPPAHPHGAFEQALRRLLVLGLLFWGKQTNFAGRDYTSGIHDGVLIVPHCVREAVTAHYPPTTNLLAQPLPAQLGEAVRSFQRVLYLYWSYVATLREGLSLVNNGLLTRSALRAVIEHTDVHPQGAEHVRLETDVPRLLFIRLMLMKLGLLQERNNTLYAASAEKFFSLPLLERARRCYRLYLDLPFWNELLYLPEVNVRPGPGPLEPAHPEILRARHTLMDRLTYETTDAWHDLATFIARIKLYVPYLLFPRQYGPRAERYSSSSNPYAWDFRLRRGWLTHREGWHMVEGGFIRALISGPFHWLGLVELDREENPNAFQLSPHAAPVLSDTALELPEESWGRLIIQPNFELVALAPVSEALLVRLDRFADRISLEHIAQYRITRTSITRAIQRGLHAETIQEILEQAAGGEIPQNVRYSLVEWERQARRIELWPNATLLEVHDEALLDTLFATPETRALFGRRLAPRLAELPTHHLQVVQELLWERNYLPALTPAPADPAAVDELTLREPQWRLHDDGLLQPFFAVLDLYLVAEVERFSERDPATSWYKITASSLQHGLEHGLSLDHIVRFLQQYCENGIPPSFLIRLKLWGGGYGPQHTLQVEQAPLLRLPAQILQDLQADAEVNALLGSEVDQQSRLVRLDQHNLERVLTLLRERGFSIE